MVEKRYNWIDWAKAISIYAVVFGHICNSSNAPWVLSVARIGCLFHMPVFFFISGYLWKIKDLNIWDYLLKNIKSLIIPYLFFNIFSGIILYKLQARDVWIDGLKSFFTCESHAFSGPSWFLVSLFLIKYISFYFVKNRKEILFLFVAFLTSVLSVIIPIKLLFGVTSAMMALIFFAFGHYVKQHDLFGHFFRLNIYIRLSVFCVFFVSVILFNKLDICINIASGSITGNPVVCYLQSFLAIGMAISFCLLLNDFRLNIVKNISLGTISIMGFHLTILQCLWVVQGKLPFFLQWIIDSPYSSITTFTLSILVSVFLRKYVPCLIGNRA